jgi:hypothetical protein
LKTVQVQVMDLLYNNQVCSLVYLQDITSLIQESGEVATAASETPVRQFVALIKDGSDDFVHNFVH